MSITTTTRTERTTTLNKYFNQSRNSQNSVKSFQVCANNSKFNCTSLEFSFECFSHFLFFPFSPFYFCIIINFPEKLLLFWWCCCSGTQRICSGFLSKDNFVILAARERCHMLFCVIMGSCVCVRIYVSVSVYVYLALHLSLCVFGANKLLYWNRLACSINRAFNYPIAYTLRRCRGEDVDGGFGSVTGCPVVPGNPGSRGGVRKFCERQ